MAHSGRRVITFGTFDLYHAGHVNILERAKALGTHLTVGLSSDEFSFTKKKRYPVYSYEQRRRTLESCRYVDAVFQEESLEQKRQYIIQHRAAVLVMGDDWVGRFDNFRDICEVVYVPRTPGVSSTATLEKILNRA